MKTLVSTIVATLAFGISMAFATPTVSYLPSPAINISGSIIYQSSSTNNGTTSKATLKTVSFNSKSLIALLNASPTVQTTLQDVTGVSRIPAGSYFIFDIYDGYEYDLVVTNKNGFSFPLYGYDYSEDSTYDYGYIEWDYDVTFAGYSLNNTTGAGTEQDQTGIYFEFEDYNGNDIECYCGNGTFNWTYGAASGDTQKASLSVSLHPAGYYAEVNGNSDAISKNTNISGSGSATIEPLGEPFYWWW